MMWNSKGTACLFLATSDTDATNQSYYGEAKLHYLPADANKADLACAVPVPKDGPGGMRSSTYQLPALAALSMDPRVIAVLVSGTLACIICIVCSRELPFMELCMHCNTVTHN